MFSLETIDIRRRGCRGTGKVPADDKKTPKVCEGTVSLWKQKRRVDKVKVLRRLRRNPDDLFMLCSVEFTCVRNNKK